MSGIIAVYALVVSVLIAGSMKPPPDVNYSLYNGCMHLACGLSVGLTGLAAGYAIGIVGDSVRSKLDDVEKWAKRYTRAFAHTCSSRAFSSAWF